MFEVASPDQHRVHLQYTHQDRSANVFDLEMSFGAGPGKEKKSVSNPGIAINAVRPLLLNRQLTARAFEDTLRLSANGKLELTESQESQANCTVNKMAILGR